MQTSIKHKQQFYITVHKNSLNWKRNVCYYLRCIQQQPTQNKIQDNVFNMFKVWIILLHKEGQVFKATALVVNL